MSGRLVLIDGSWLAFRAFYALPSSLSTPDGLPTNAIYGFATMFRKLIAGKRPDYGAVVFDAPGPTAREARFAGYKASRPSMPRDLVVQLPHIDRLVAANGFPMLRVAGVEADDVIGTLAARGGAAGMEVLIVAGDKDFAQLVGDHVRMFDSMKDVTYDAELVRKKWGVSPDHVVDRLAIVGDAVDEIPGVAGIGEKGALALLDKYGSLAGIYEHLDELKGKQRETFAAQREIAFLSRELATIDTAVPGTPAPVELAIPPIDEAALDGLYRELAFFSLLKGAPADDALPDVPVLTSHAEVRAFLDALGTRTAAVVPVIDAPIGDSDGWCGLAVCPLNGTPVYFPLAGDGPRADEGAVGLILAWLGDPLRPKATHEAKALWKACAQRGTRLAGVAIDAMLASFLIDPTRHLPEQLLHGNPHRIEEIVKDYAQRTVRPRKWLVGSGKGEQRVADVPIARSAVWSGELAAALAEIAPAVRDRLALEGQLGVYEDVERPLSEVLGQMELDGIAVDATDLGRMREEFVARRIDVERRIHELAGHVFNVASTQQLATVLFEELKLPVIKKTKTGYSTDADVLERLVSEHPIAGLLLEQRMLAKLINTYVEVLLAAIDPRDGRVHATLQQTVGVSGRLITTDPDLQRTPVRTPEGRRIRRAFVAPPGSVLISADWSQIELRVLAHFSRDPVLVASFRDHVDVHRRTASELFGVDLADVTAEQRNVGKTVNFATIYGQGATALGQILGIPRKDAAGHIERYFATYAGVRAWLDATIAAAGVEGCVTTILGRKRYIPELSSRNTSERQGGERIAANTPIQGSAADLCKLAMLKVAAGLRERGLAARMLLQIHDELVLEVPEAEVDAVSVLVRAAMEHPMPLDAPLVVNLGVGPTWGDAH